MVISSFALIMQYLIILFLSLLTVLVNARLNEHYTYDIEIIKRNPVNDYQQRHINNPPLNSLNSLVRRTKEVREPDSKESSRRQSRR